MTDPFKTTSSESVQFVVVSLHQIPEILLSGSKYHLYSLFNDSDTE